MKNYWPLYTQLFFAVLNICLKIFSKESKYKTKRITITTISQILFSIFIFVLCYYNHPNWAWFFILLPLISTIIAIIELVVLVLALSEK